MPADHDTRHDTRPLGRTGIHVLPLGIGTNKWRRADRGAVLEIYRTIHDAGPCMIDTAEIYFSERVVGDCLRAGQHPRGDSIEIPSLSGPSLSAPPDERA